MRRKGKTCWSMTSYISAGAKFLKCDHRRSSYDLPRASAPSGYARCSTGVPRRRALFSALICRSSSRRRNSRYVICSITSSGLEMPPDQKASHTLSTWLLMVPVITTQFLFRTALRTSRPLLQFLTNFLLRRIFLPIETHERTPSNGAVLLRQVCCLLSTPA